jgi:hydrogenase expression/formation protein HypC
MCLGVPGRIVEIDGLVAIVDFWGMRREVRLELVDQPVTVGDYILNHVGYAIRRIPEIEIQGTLDLYEELLREAANEEDLMTADVRAELSATSSDVARGVTAAVRRGGSLDPPGVRRCLSSDPPGDPDGR